MSNSRTDPRIYHLREAKHEPRIKLVLVQSR
jgi:hypothetical protein